MAHMILEKDTMFSTIETPWHRLGKVLPKAPSIEEALVAAGLDWKVKMKNLIAVDENGKPVQNQGEIIHRAVMREDTKDILGVVGPSWTPLQNREAFDFFDPFIKEGTVALETAGSLRNNKYVWVLGKIQSCEGEVIQNDPINRYVLLCHGHDGTMAVRVGYTDIRVVCQNTMNMAFNSKASQLIRIKHSAKVQENLANVQAIMKIVEGEFRANLEQLAKLTRKNINQSDVKKFVHVNFFNSEDLTSSNKKMSNYLDMVGTINRLIETGRGSDIKGVKGTAYGLLNAATEYLTHEAQTSDETRLNSLWFGDNSRLNAKITDYLLEMVA
jgi:phage/plasmid-like protein (TIGR03299 family)